MKSAEVKNNIPASALFSNEDTQCVWIVKSDSTIVKRKVDVESIHPDGSATITSGLENNETDILLNSRIDNRRSLFRLSDEQT